MRQANWRLVSMMKFCLFLVLSPLLLAISCSSLRRPRAAGGGEIPTAARPEDVAKVDEFFKNGGKFGFHPEPEKTPPLTPQNSAYVVELDQQRVYFYHGSDLIAASKLASGRAGYRTETGNYVIGQKDLNHRSTRYGSFVNSSGNTMVSDVTEGFDPTPIGGRFQGAFMKYFQRFERAGRVPTAMGFHQGVVPGTPVSHGCVRLPGAMASWFYKTVPTGTPVIIRGTKYGVPAGAKQRRAKRSPKIHPSLKKLEPPAEPQTPPPGAEDAPPATGAEASAPPTAAPAPAPPAEAPEPAPPVSPK
jgi:lipoprotein-anchoring transpeptidase ErfK/SrfK